MVLGQSEGLNIREVFTKRKVLLVPLSEGQIGTEAAYLLGSLLVGALWHATLQRSAIPADRRRPVFAYLDEFQSIVRVSNDLADMLAKARGLGLGLILAHQYIKQVPEQIRAAVLGTARNQVFFQMDHDDAQIVGKRLAPVLTADDLIGLGAYEIAASLTVNGASRTPVTARTVALPEPVRNPTELRAALAQQHGVSRAEVEAGLRTRTQPAGRAQRGTFGQVPTNQEGGDR